MTAMALEKVWTVTKVEALGSGVVATDSKNFLLGIKNALKAHGWSVAYSCDSSSDDASDLWLTASNLVWAASGAHSWIVLTNSAISSNFSVCIDCLGTSGLTYLLKVYCSTSAYNNDGTTSAKPTSSGTEITLLNGVWRGSSALSCITALVFTSSDYTCTRVYLIDSLNEHGLWIFDVPKDPASYWTVPYVALVSVYDDTGQNFLFDTYCAAADPKIRTNIGATTVVLTGGGIGSAAYHNYKIYSGSTLGYGSSFDGGFLLLPVYLVSLTAASPGLYGQLYDFYWSNSCFEVQRKANPCSYLPSSTSDLGFIIFGCFTLGNDGFTHLITV